MQDRNVSAISYPDVLVSYLSFTNNFRIRKIAKVSTQDLAVQVTVALPRRTEKSS